MNCINCSLLIGLFVEIHHLHHLDDHNLVVGYKNLDNSMEPSLGCVSFASIESPSVLTLVDLKDVVSNPTDDFFGRFDNHKYFTAYIPQR